MNYYKEAINSAKMCSIFIEGVVKKCKEDTTIDFRKSAIVMADEQIKSLSILKKALKNDIKVSS